MPRVRLDRKSWLASMARQREKDYHVALISRMVASGKSQADLGRVLGISQQTFSYRLNHNSFTFKDLLILFNELDFTDEEILRFVKLERS